jgi:hypothetical protein
VKSNKKCSLEFLKNVCIFQSKQPYLSNVVDFQSSRLRILARTNTLALNTTLNRRKLNDSPVCDQKQEVPVAAMFVNGSGQNEQSL